MNVHVTACVQSVHDQHIWSQIVTPASMMFWSKSKQVCVKRFRGSSMSWIFVSYMHCCITLHISTFKAHDDWWPWSTLMKLWYIWCILCLVISYCSITFSVFWLSQGSVATLIRWGGRSSYCDMCCSFLNLTVKNALRSVDVWQSYRQK